MPCIYSQDGTNIFRASGVQATQYLKMDAEYLPQRTEWLFPTFFEGDEPQYIPINLP